MSPSTVLEKQFLKSLNKVENYTFYYSLYYRSRDFAENYIEFKKKQLPSTTIKSNKVHRQFIFKKMKDDSIYRINQETLNYLL